MKTRIFRSLLIVIAVIIATFAFTREISYLNYLKQENSKIEKRIDKLQSQNSEYQQDIDSIKNDKRYIENVLREELGMIKEGEKIFRFEN